MTVALAQIASATERPSESKGRGIVAGPDRAILGRIRQDAIGLALWRRRPSALLPVWLRTLPDRQLPDGRVLARVDDLPAAVASAFERTPAGAAARALQADIVDLARLFAEIARSPIVDVRIEAVTDDACWKFHRDQVELRLLTTYRGPTTQFVSPIHADAALREQRAFDGPVMHQPPDSVAIFKGASRGDVGVVHRSPPIAGQGIARLLLCVNQPSAASPDLWE